MIKFQVISLDYFLLLTLNIYKHKMRVLGNVIKSKSDNRLYKAIKLKNQIQCLIISDQQTKKSSAAMSVGVGSLQDPNEAQGLAHYLQHMLFMGTSKYPNENDYSNFIAKNFGQSNAYTSQDQTNYHFEVSSNAFIQTLDRFAQFFVSPLMLESSSERELNAVHSQHTKNLLNDTWRKYQLTKFLAKQGHPYKKFSTGNKESLSNKNLRQMLHSFYDKNYSSNLMKLVVFGNESPEQMSKIVEQKFSEVPNKNYLKFKMREQPYLKQNFNKLYKILPIQDKKVLQISWVLKDKSMYYQNTPSSYLSYIIGHQGKGSLLSFLIAEGLATGVSAGGHDAYNCFSQFQIRISLTKKGVENTKQIVQYVLYFLQKLRTQEPQKWVFDELRDVYRMKFDYLEKRQGMSFTSGLAKRLQNRKLQEVLIYPYYMKQWRPDLIKQYINELQKDNMMIFLQAKEVETECSSVEPIYQTKFGITDLDGLEPRVFPVTFPEQNPFLPKNFDVIPLGTQIYPKCIHKSNQHEAYFKKDHKFELPKVIIKTNLYFQGHNNVKQSLCRQIYLDMLTEKMRQFIYLGDSAETYSGIQYDSYYALSIEFSGFRDSTLKFVKPYLNQVFSFEPTDTKYFETVKQKFERAISNYFLGDPYRLAYNLKLLSTRHGAGVSQLQRLNMIKQITLEDIKNFSKSWNKKLFAQTYISGNLEQQQAKQIIDQIQQTLKSRSEVLQKNQIGEIRPVKIPHQHVWIVEQMLKSETQQNSSIIVHFQHEASNVRSKVLQHLAHNFTKQPAFDYLRTKQQLGYIVMCLTDDNRGVLGMSILVQSAVKSSHQISHYIDTFLSQILVQKLKQLDQKLFNEFKQSLKTSISQKDKNLTNQSSRYWSQINKHTYIFDRKQKQLHQLSSITLEQFKNFINLLFYLNPKRLEVHLMSQKHKETNQKIKADRLKNNALIKVYHDPELLKKKMGLHPDFYGHL